MADTLKALHTFIIHFLFVLDAPPPPSECSAAAPSAGKEWEEYVQIRGLVEKIRKKQKGESGKNQQRWIPQKVESTI